MNQDLIDTDSYDNYSYDDLYKDICNILKRVKDFNHNSINGTVNIFSYLVISCINSNYLFLRFCKIMVIDILIVK
jgi:hypothetical protein